MSKVSGFGAPYFIDESFSAQKQFRSREGTHCTPRGEALNAFNRRAFVEPHNLGPNDLNFGFVNCTINGPRQLQVTARIQF